MIDSQHFYAEEAERSTLLGDLGLESKRYGLVTLHRPSNVDDLSTLQPILDALVTIGADCPLLFPVHPRTRGVLENSGIDIPAQRLRLLDPVGYLDFSKLMRHSAIVLTDSGGIQEETTVLGVPCLTIRENTERPITCELGTNTLVGLDRDRIVAEAGRVLSEGVSGARIPDLWDGHAAERIADVIAAWFNER